MPFNDYEICGEVTVIFLENKKGLKLETLIDTEDLERIKAMNFDKDSYYVVDHKNQNKLDNRKENLRFIPQYNNLQNRKGANSNSSTGVRNVNLITRYGGKQEYWVQICKNGERFKWEFGLHEFDKACLFAEEKRKELFGEFAGNG